MTDRQIHDRIMEILEDKIRSGGVLAGVSAGYGTRKGAKKAVCTKRKKGILPPKGRCRPPAKKRVAKKPIKRVAKKRVAKKRSSAWIDFVKSYAKEYGISYKEAMQSAGPEYRKIYGLPAKRK